MDVWNYQLEIVAGVAVIVSGIIVAMVADYLLNHNEILSDHGPDDPSKR